MTNHYTTMSAPQRNRGAATRNLLRLPVLMLLIMLLFASKGWGQTVFVDDFNRIDVSPGGTPSMIYTSTNTGNGSSIIESTLATGTVPYLKIANGATAGRSYLTGPLSSFSTPFNTTLSSNSGLVTWCFNARHNRNTLLSGFGAGNYGYAVVLVASSSDLSTANGYAVVSGGSGTNVYRLVKFTGGLFANTGITNMVTGMTQTDRRDYMSVEVTYDPITGTWFYYDRTDGPSGTPLWADPTAGAYTLRGTSNDATYTNTAMTSFGYLWNYSTSAGTNAYVDNFSVNVAPPVLTPILNLNTSSLIGFYYILGSGPSTSQSYSVNGANLDGNAVTVTGNTDYEVSIDNSSFFSSVNIPYTPPTLASTAVYVRLKAGLSVGNYNLENIGNSGGGVVASSNVSCSGFVVGLPAAYTWTGATDNDWQASSNWNPARSVPAINDILQFNNGATYTITNVPTQTIAQLLVSGGTKITLQAAATATLTIAGTLGDDLSVAGSGSELNISGSNVLTIALNTGTNGLVCSSMTFSGAAHVLKSVDANSLVFASGSVFKATIGFTGNAFGATNLNSVKFQSGSTYIQDAGSNPFGAGAPTSVLTFETGSLYKFTAASGGPSYSGRTYANFENDSPLSIQNNQGSSAFTCDNYTATSGIVNWDFSGGLFIKGNISVSSSATLTFGKATKVTNLALNGTSAQSISGTGLMDFGANGTLVVGNAAGVTLNSQATLYNLTITSGTFTLNSGASLITNGAVNGNVTIERSVGAWTDNLHGWHLLSSPVASQTIATAFTDAPPENYDFYKWNEVTNTWLNQKNGANGITSFTPGTGYLVAYAIASTKKFTGILNTTDVSITGLTRSGGTNQGWNLLGNPFPSAIIWGTTNWALTNITETAKIWQETTSSYVDIPANTGKIPSMNGFMVETSGSGSLTIPHADRVHDATPWYKSKEGTIKLIAHDLDNNTAQESNIKVNAAATETFDSQFDSHFLAGFAPEFYSIVGNEQFSTNTLPGIATNSIIPLGFVKNASGNFSIELSENSGIGVGDIFLTDKKTGIITELTKMPVYNFSASESDEASRFYLSFDKNNLNPPSSNDIAVYTDGKILYINQKNAQEGTILVYNVIGQLLVSKNLASVANQEIDLSNLKSGVYVVAIFTGKSMFNQKIVVNH